MDFLLEALTNWLKEMLVGGIMSNLSGMFDSVNQQVADISVQVGQTPQGWNGSCLLYTSIQEDCKSQHDMDSTDIDRVMQTLPFAQEEPFTEALSLIHI